MALSRHILVVDDDEDFRKVLVARLTGFGHTVIEASSGNQAWKLLTDNNNQMDFIISDVRMPDGDGITLTEKIQNEAGGRPPVLLLSGFSNFSKTEALNKGAINLLRKPDDLHLITNHL